MFLETDPEPGLLSGELAVSTSWGPLKGMWGPQALRKREHPASLRIQLSRLMGSISPRLMDPKETASRRGSQAALYTWIHINVRMCTYTHISITRRHAYIYIYVYTHAYVFVYIYICTHIHMCIYIHIYIHIHTYILYTRTHCFLCMSVNT